MMNELMHGFASEIFILAIEAVIFLPFIMTDCRIIEKIAALGYSEKNPAKYPVAAVSMFACGLIVFCILGSGFDFAVFDSDLNTALVVVSALCAFGMALPICDFVRYRLLKHKREVAEEARREGSR